MHIKYKMISVAFCLLSILNLKAEEISVYFLSMPNKILPSLDIVRKKELLDAQKDSTHATIKNLFNDTLVLQQMTDNYLSIQSGIAQTEIALLTMTNQSRIICVIQTFCAPVCDSHIHFYTTQWKLLNTTDFFIPEKTAWFFKENPDETGKILIQSLLSDISLTTYHLNPDDLSLTQTYNTPQYLDKETALQIKPYQKETPRIFNWVRNQYQ
ncbi:MAG: DUF3256 family protein [Dysgonamonadaceae bacterium]|nr:DUF3256 family protein [Dysgonamonadaceae bacterium]